MNISQLLQLERKKAQLQKKKHSLLQKALQKKKREQINADHDSVKKGYIEKTKFITKKHFEIIHEKARTNIPVQIQDNASVSSYLIKNSNYQKIYDRTKKMITFPDNKQLSNPLNALKAYAEEHYEKVLHVKLTFAKQINCGSVIRPFQLQLPNKGQISLQKQYPIPKAIILVKSIKSQQKNPNYKKLVSYPITLKQYGEFIKQWKNDKEFKKKLSANRILILCDWDIFKMKNKFVETMMEKGFVVFPFDTKKVPYFLEQQYQGVTYEKYLQLMIENEYALIKSGKQHTVHLKLNKEHSSEDLCENVKEAVVETVSKLIQRNKDKSGNHLMKAEAKTNTSINFTLYEKQ